MSATFDVRILTPEDVFFRGKVTSLTAPGEEGYLGILAHHAPLVTPLARGILTLKDEKGEERKFDIDSGFLEVSNNQVLLLVEKISKSKNSVQGS